MNRCDQRTHTVLAHRPDERQIGTIARNDDHRGDVGSVMQQMNDLCGEMLLGGIQLDRCWRCLRGKAMLVQICLCLARSCIRERRKIGVCTCEYGGGVVSFFEIATHLVDDAHCQSVGCPFGVLRMQHRIYIVIIDEEGGALRGSLGSCSCRHN